ncbi:TIGR01177 family methyltransferase [Halobacterium litoreum]|uniref:tRNA (guanine(10)-N(2))-dimethyltransferase n=1 Tax=Halobacterium litoreum TaxID=2039234 RepID=A0ABD5NFD3_9EURY|nr:TIGR01177 family methyltransferase [Halobacterium litoreum]UHH13162.1 TIGR01177 family methyltransferase [Halobacterium litoreum]
MFVIELGGDDDEFAAAEARAAAPDARVVAPGLAVADTVDRERFAGLAYAHRASGSVADTDASVESAVDALRDAPIDREGTVAVRARNVRNTTEVATQKAERALGGVLVDRGFEVDLDDPDHELRALFSGDECHLGWLAVESVRDYGDRKPTDRPFFQPGSMDPLLARAVCNLARVTPGDRVLDPMCGTGGVLIEAGLLGARPLGTDAQAKMTRGARENLAHFLDSFDVARADATSLPLRDDSVDAAVFDAPYGRQSKIETHDLSDLVGGALAEVRRVADRCVLVADRDWREEAEAAGWTVESRFERRVHRSLTRYVLVLA